MIEMADKAVSTEDLFVETPRNTCLEVARLEAVLNTLVENKVESIKNEHTKVSSLTSSPKMLINRLRITSTSTTSSKDKEDNSHRSNNRKYKRRRKEQCDSYGDSKGIKKVDGRINRQRVSSSSPESPRYVGRCCDRTPPLDDDTHESLGFLQYDCSTDKYGAPAASSTGHNAYPCCRTNEANRQIRMHYDDDYISLKIEDYDDVEEDTIITEEALRRARRKRRRKRKRRMKKHMRQLAITPLPVEETVKVIDPDELPQRARWTIVATACLLLFMCLLLVGVTLRMAPIIDDMVRKENEELMNSLHREPPVTHRSHHNTSTTPVPQ